MKKIGILTSGGDSPGMNAAIWASVNAARANGIEIIGIEDGYKGLLEGRMGILDGKSVEGILGRGGTFLGTARCLAMLTEEGRQKAVDQINAAGIEGLIVVGGDGSFKGAKIISHRGIPTVGLPGTIDNDLPYTEYTIGYDTACNTAIDAVMRVSDTMKSHDRVGIVEVMGRHCGDIAVNVGLVVGADYLLVPEVCYDVLYDLDNLSKRLLEQKANGKDYGIIIMAEGVDWENKHRSEKLCKLLRENTGLDIRATVLGHVQRGGAPSVFDRKIAVGMANRAVDLLKENTGNRVVGIKNGKVFDMSIDKALDIERRFDMESYEIAIKMGGAY